MTARIARLKEMKIRNFVRQIALRNMAPTAMDIAKVPCLCIPNIRLNVYVQGMDMNIRGIEKRLEIERLE